MIIYVILLTLALFNVTFQGKYRENLIYMQGSNNSFLNYKVPIVYATSFLYFSILLLLSIMRTQEVGTDGIMYYKFYWYGNFEMYFDPFINYIYQYSLQRNDYSYFIYITSVIFILVSYYTIMKLNFNKWILIYYFVASYYYLISFNVVRQSIAISFVFLAVSIIYSSEKLTLKRTVLFIIVIFVGSGFHNSAVLALSFILFRFFKLNHLILLMGLILITIGYFTSFIKSLIQPIFSFFEFYTLKYGTGSDFFVMDVGSKGLIEYLPIVVQYLFLYFGYIIYMRNNREFAGTYILNYYFVFLVLYTFSGIEAVDRFQYYFYPSIILYYSWLFSKIKENKKYEYLNFLVIIFWALYYLLRLIGNKHGVVPYLM